MKFWFAFLVLLTFSTMNVKAQEVVSPVVITEDFGGFVEDYKDRIDLYNKTNTFVIFKGTCWSACALYMKVKNICAMPDAYFFMHGIYKTIDGREVLQLQESAETYKAYTPPRVFKMVQKYHVAEMGVTTGIAPVSVHYSSWVTRFYRQYKDNVYETWLAIKADKVVPKCS